MTGDNDALRCKLAGERQRSLYWRMKALHYKRAIDRQAVILFELSSDNERLTQVNDYLTQSRKYWAQVVAAEAMTRYAGNVDKIEVRKMYRTIP